MRSRRISTALALLPWILCSGAPLAALQQSQQVPPFGQTVPTGTRYLLHGSGPPSPAATFTRSETLDFDNDGFLDVAILVGNELRVLFAPGLYEVLNEEIFFGVADFCALRGEGPDELLCVGPAGATLVGWGENGWMTRCVSTVPATHVERIDSHGPARRALIVTGGGYEVWTIAEDADLPFAPWAAAQSHVSAVPILELRLGDVDGDGAPELCMMIPGGACAVNANQETVVERVYPIDCVSMDLIGMASDERVWMAIVATDPANGMQFLAVIGENGLVDADVLGVGNGIVSLRGGNTGPIGDGLDDLMFSYRSDHAVGHLVNAGDESTGPQYSLSLPGFSEVIPYGPSAPNPDNLAQPAVADLDNDGDDDTFQAIASTGNFFVYRSPQIEESLAKPWVGTETSPCMTKAAGELFLHLDLLHAPLRTQGADTLQVLTYRRASPSAPLDPVPIDVQTFDLAAPDSVDDDGNSHYGCTIGLVDTPLAGPCTHFDSLYFIVVRALSSDNFQCFPARLYAIQGSLDPANSAFIAQHSPDNEIDFSIEHPCNGLNPSPHAGPPQEVPGGGPCAACLPFDDQAGSGDELPCLPGPTIGGNPPSGG